MISIYKIKNNINNKLYIGQAKNLHKRWVRHLRDVYKFDYPLYRGMKKHGVDNFFIELIEEVENNKANERESYWAKELNTKAPNGYNATSCGDHLVEFSEETRKKMSESAKGKIITEETKQRMSQASKNMWNNNEFRRKLSDAHKAQWNRFRQEGRKMSDESRQKMRESALKRKPVSEETKIKIGLASKGRLWSESQKQKLRETRAKNKLMKMKLYEDN